MKRALLLGIALMLGAGLGFGVAACSADDVPTTTSTVAPTTTSTVAPTTTSTTAATTTTTVPSQEPVNLKFATTFGETEAGGTLVQRFCDYVEEKTDGAVTFDVYFVGALGSETEELSMVRAGSVDMIVLRSDAVPDQVPLLCFPMWAPSDGRSAVDYFDRLVYEDPDTSALIQAEAAVNNVTYLGCTARGTSVFIGVEPFSVLSDLTGRAFAASGPRAAFEALGYTIVESEPADTYENLSAGVVQAAHAGLAVSLQLRWYEIAKHYLFDGTYAVGNPFTVNLDTWARLTPETQATFRAAAREMADLSVELEAVDRAQAVKTLEAAGVTVGALTPEDRAAWFRLLVEAETAECMGRAERLGIVDDMKLVLSRAAEYAGVARPR